MLRSRRWLTYAGLSSFGVAIFHILIAPFPAACLYFGAPKELVENTPWLFASCWIIAVIFIVFGQYAWSGAGRVRRLPYLRSILLGVGCIYTLRGALIVLQLMIWAQIVRSPEVVHPQDFVASLVALAIGVAYLIGVFSGWRDLAASFSHHDPAKA
ncbi:MAG: hypothetical protein MUF51_08555 [Vicinamibacteria bacterium]|jgi:hypothetical protein|nr:hypothetical protein [Vicinamibacteria bacterium]